MAGEQVYGDGTNSSVGTQIRQEHYNKKSVIELKDETYLSQMSDAMSQPKHFGKKMKKYKYIAMLDDANNNSQGLDVNGAILNPGNLYGSSRDIGTITSKLPTISETGGRVNRVGFTRVEIEAVIENYGFFHEYTKDSYNFDTDAELKMHNTREATRGAIQINEDILYITLVNAAGVAYYPGQATSDATVTGDQNDEEDVKQSVPSYMGLINLDIELDNNKCPRDTSVIAGSKLTDTKVVQSARYMFISSDVKADFMSMTDLHGNPAFKEVASYTDANKNGKYVKSIHGEIGQVGPFRLIVHPNAVLRAGAGADVGSAGGTNAANDGFRVTDVAGTDKYDVYPCLVVGSKSFTHIGFEYGAGAKSKFKVRNVSPEQAGGSHDPFYKTGFSSIEFWQGVLVDRPEWLATYNIAAKLY